MRDARGREGERGTVEIVIAGADFIEQVDVDLSFSPEGEYNFEEKIKKIKIRGLWDTTRDLRE